MFVEDTTFGVTFNFLPSVNLPHKNIILHLPLKLPSIDCPLLLVHIGKKVGTRFPGIDVISLGYQINKSVLPKYVAVVVAVKVAVVF